jgi:hypothetical protein
MANGDAMALPNNSKVIHIIVFTVCLLAMICIVTSALCVIYKIPDMNTPLSGGFTHVTDTLIGALIAMLINTRPQPQQPPITTPQEAADLAQGAATRAASNAATT